MDLGLDGVTRENMSIAGLYVDRNNPVDTLTFSNYRNFSKFKLYNIEKVKLCYFPSFEIIDVSLSEFMDFYKSTDTNSDLYKRSRLNIDGTKIILNCIKVCIESDIYDTTYSYRCHSYSGGLCVHYLTDLGHICIFDINTGMSIKEADYVQFAVNVVKGLFYSSKLNKLIFSYNIFNYFGLSERHSLNRVEIARLNGEPQHSTVNSKVPVLSRTTLDRFVEYSNGFTILLDTCAFSLEKNEDLVIVNQNCRELYIKSNGDYTINNLVLNKSIENIKVNGNFSVKNLYYSKDIKNSIVIFKIVRYVISAYALIPRKNYMNKLEKLIDKNNLYGLANCEFEKEDGSILILKDLINIQTID